MSPYDTFWESLEGIPWLENLGQPHPWDVRALRIHAWDLWQGPEDPAVSLMNDLLLSWEDELRVAAEGEALQSRWDAIEKAVFAMARPRAPFEADQDVWFGPNAAVWSAAWTAALAGCWLWQFGSLSRASLSEDASCRWRLDAIWGWYADGHWPCSLYWPYGGDLEMAQEIPDVKLLVVF
jgi:hypothetical protein